MSEKKVASTADARAEHAIVYSTKKFGNGWSIEAEFPKSVSLTDRRIVFDSMVQYQRTIAETHPDWIFNLTTAPTGVYLLISRTLDAAGNVFSPEHRLSEIFWGRTEPRYWDAHLFDLRHSSGFVPACEVTSENRRQIAILRYFEEQLRNARNPGPVAPQSRSAEGPKP